MRRLEKAKPQREPTIALINIVFLMLVFFMVAGTLSQPLDPALKLVRTDELEGKAPPNALVVYPDGRLTYEGSDQTDVSAFVESLSEEDRATVRLLPDRELPARTLVTLTRDLRAAGVKQVMLATERSLQ
ncbi:ExbD/TolR family protein [Neptunicoccus cionae]|uniref:ExbD/TolR family protein n=1 Tax=Neptunicoccus cionae TaxID=2035344 RepID=UPI000C790F22|nr:biopolymer transporter ExbD [Amylibacter cionae]PLS21301.1 biopolymer transporter ExbD [Amylibacter cionae]